MAELAAPGSPDDWQWLVGTYWYCPAPSTPAIRTEDHNAFHWVVDQTVWKITGARQGYFWGVASTLLTPVGEEPDPGGKTDTTFLGSITPDGRVHMTFISSVTTTTVGTGQVTDHRGERSFQMQMSSGPPSAMVIHWAYMMPVAPGDPAWDDLPGAGVPVETMVGGLEPPEPSGPGTGS